MFEPLRKLAKWPSSLVIDFVRGEVMRKADICADTLEEARKLSQLRKHGPPLNALVARAGELLDDLDEMIVTLDPMRNTQAMAVTARLHGQLEQIEAAVAAARRGEARVAKRPQIAKRRSP
jgi:hypothetical protein